MRKAVSCRWSAVNGQKFVFFCLLASVFWLLSCSVPNLEEPECIEARQPLKEFYSFHFGNDMQPTPENLKQRERFLTSDFINRLQTASGETDPFTLTNDLPKAFRVGGCKVVEPQKRVNFGVLLFWKTDTRSEQREIQVEAIKQNDKWLINKISN
jgi:hypothetical protein